MSTVNRSTIKTRNVNVSTGIDKHVKAPITVGGVAFTPADLKAVFTAHTAALDAADGLHKQWTDQLLVSDAAGAKANATYQSLRSYLVGQYGSDANAVLHDFGMTPPKPRGAKTVKTKVEAAAKRAATRAARHTMGKNQKKGVTGGTVTATATATSPTAQGAGAAAPASPAASASGPAAPPSPAKPAAAT